MEILRDVLYGVSAQRPSHSLFIGGQQLPLEARMGGIFLGFLCAVALLAVLGRLHASQPPGGVLGAACWLLIALTGLDGLNAFLFDGNLPHLYAPGTALRLLTGLGAGLAVGLMAVPVVASVVWSRPNQEASIEEPVELAAGLAVAGLVGGLLLASVVVLLWPVGVGHAGGRARGVRRRQPVCDRPGDGPHATRRSALADLRGGLIGSLGVGLLELAGLAALRTFLISRLRLHLGHLSAGAPA